MTRTFVLPHSKVILHPHGATTSLHRGGEPIPAVPHDTASYRARAQKYGYGDDTLAMCQEHELLHTMYGELVHGGVSPVMHALAYPDDPDVAPRKVQGMEEYWVLEMARWINQGPRGRR